jgi:hypothetical protein
MKSGLGAWSTPFFHDSNVTGSCFPQQNWGTLFGNCSDISGCSKQFGAQAGLITFSSSRCLWRLQLPSVLRTFVIDRGVKALGELLALHAGRGMPCAPHVHGRDALDELAVSLEIIASISVNWN